MNIHKKEIKVIVKYNRINEGDTVLDLLTGAGNDCLVARAIVGETGKVPGLDLSDSQSWWPTML